MCALLCWRECAHVVPSLAGPPAAPTLSPATLFRLYLGFCMKRDTPCPSLHPARGCQNAPSRFGCNVAYPCPPSPLRPCAGASKYTCRPHCSTLPVHRRTRSYCTGPVVLIFSLCHSGATAMAFSLFLASLLLLAPSVWSGGSPGDFPCVWTEPPKDTPSVTWPDGPVMGDGNLGVSVGGAPGSITLYITTNGYWGAGNNTNSSVAPLTWEWKVSNCV